MSCTKIISGNELGIYVAHNIVLLMVHLWRDTLKPEMSMD